MPIRAQQQECSVHSSEAPQPYFFKGPEGLSRRIPVVQQAFFKGGGALEHPVVDKIVERLTGTRIRFVQSSGRIGFGGVDPQTDKQKDVLNHLVRN